jgi:hypothetical protein
MIALICLGCLGFVIYTLIPQRPPARLFSGRDLLLSAEDLGPGWCTTGEDYSQVPVRWHAETWSRDFAMYNNQQEKILVGGMSVFRHEDLRDALLTFDDNPDMAAIWPAPDTLLAFCQPRYAKRWRIWWTDESMGYDAVYEEFVVIFVMGKGESAFSLDAAVEEGIISYEQIARWICTLDERAGQLLGKVP